MREVRHQRIIAPDAGGHGLGMSDGQSWLVEDCLIDLSACPLEGLDEAVGVTWGSRALFRRCVIRGAGKLLLCGSGDADKLAVERGKTVIFEDCILEDFGRRGPEVQSCMRVILRRCLIRNWGSRDGSTCGPLPPGRITAAASRPMPASLTSPASGAAGGSWRGTGWPIWARPGMTRACAACCARPAGCPASAGGLTATAGGHVRAADCRATRWWIRLEGHHGPRMRREDAAALEKTLEAMRRE